MRLLSRAVLINWHLFDCEDVAFHGDSALLGKNRSGKSTALDAIQVVLAGNNSRLFNLNGSASETGKRERSVLNYCLCRLSDEYAKRSEARTYVALVFEDEDGKSPPVSIGIALEAKLGESKEAVRSLFIVQGVALRTSDFYTLIERDGEDSPRRTVLAWEDVRETLSERAQVAGGDLWSQREPAKDFIREYMRLLMTSGYSGDHERFVKTLINGLEFRAMKTAGDFVRKFLLERDDVQIVRLRESIKTYRDISRIIADLDERLKSLRKIEDLIEAHDRLLDAMETARYVSAFGRYAAARFANREFRQKIERRRAEIEARKAELEDAKGDETRLSDALKDIRRLLTNSSVAQKRQSIEEEIGRFKKQRETAVSAVSSLHGKVAQIVRTFVAAEEDLGQFPAFLQAASDLADMTLEVPAQEWPSNPGAVDDHLAQLAEELAPVRAYVAGSRDEETTAAAVLRERALEIRKRLSALESGDLVLHEQTRQLMDALAMKGVDARVLCQLVEVEDPNWRAAAEGLLGKDRQAIFVDPDQADEAVRLHRSDRRRFGWARVANTRKMRGMAADKKRAEPNSLASILKTDDPMVADYIAFRVGGVRLAHSQEELHERGRAIMQDGTYDDGIAIENRSARDNLLGKGAAPLERDRLERELVDVDRQLQEVEGRKKRLESVLSFMDRLEDIRQEGLAARALGTRLDEIDNALEELRERLDNIDLGADQALVDEEKALEAQQVKARERAFAVQKTVSAAEADLDALRGKLKEGEETLGSLASLDVSRRHYRAVLGAVALSARRGLLRARIEKRLGEAKATREQRVAPKFIQETARDAHRGYDELKAKLAAHRNKIDRTVIEHYYQFHQKGPGFDSASDGFIGEVRGWLASDIEKIEAADLPRYREQAGQAAEDANRMFKSSFLNELKRRFVEADAEIRRINDALRQRPLHNEIYRFSKQQNERFAPIIRLVDAVQHDDSLMLPLFASQGELDEDHPHYTALKEVEKLLLDPEVDFSDYEDYRKYFNFELIMRDKETGRETSYERRRGTGSGAEQQVPYYVAIGGALARLYHGARKPDRTDMGIGLALFDEAFSKLDGPTQRQILKFYQDIGLQTVAAAPTERRTVLLETVNAIVEVFRSGEEAETDTIVLKRQLLDELRDLNPDNKDDDALREAHRGAAE